MLSKLLAGAALALLTVPAIAADTAPGMIVSQRIAGPDGGWDYASVDPASHRLFVARTDGVMTVDLNTGAVTPQLVAAGRTHSAFVIPGSNIGVVTSSTGSGTYLFDATTGKVTADIKTGKKPDAAVYNPHDKMLYVMNAGDGIVSIIDPVAAKQLATIAVGGALEFAALDGKGHLFINIEDKNELAMVDLKTRTVMRRTRLTGCDGPSGLAYTKGGALISSCGNGIASVVEASSGRQLANVAIGAHPDAVLYDASRDRAYVPAGADGTLTVIDTSGTPHAIGTVTTQRSARTGAVDPATGKVYLPAARYAAAVGAGRPQAEPGSFEILVVSK